MKWHARGKRNCQKSKIINLQIRIVFIMLETYGIIESNPGILGGKPVIKGTRIPVRFIFDLIGQNFTIEEILDEYPSLTREIVQKIVRIGVDARESLRGMDIDKIIHEAPPNP
jgi:uncharacterized protein (DUF433 family)